MVPSIVARWSSVKADLSSECRRIQSMLDVAAAAIYTSCGQWVPQLKIVSGALEYDFRAVDGKNSYGKPVIPLQDVGRHWQWPLAVYESTLVVFRSLTSSDIEHQLLKQLEA